MDLYSGGGVNLALLWFQPINDKPYIQIKLLITKEIAAGTELTHNSYKSNMKMSYTLLTNAEKNNYHMMQKSCIIIDSKFQIKALFSSRKFLDLATVALSFLLTIIVQSYTN